MRTKNFKMMLTPEEYIELQELAHQQGVTAADLVRSQILGPRACVRLPSHSILRDILRQLSGIGTNMNQIAMNMNKAAISKEINKISWDSIAAEFNPMKKEQAAAYKMLTKQLGLVISKKK
jgi:hypothetical protein